MGIFALSPTLHEQMSAASSSHFEDPSTCLPAMDVHSATASHFSVLP